MSAINWELTETVWRLINKSAEKDGRLLSGEDFEMHFGERLREMGFVPHNDGKEWYSFKNDLFFCSIIFVHDLVTCDILLRIQPLCAEIIFPLKHGSGAFYDQTNSSILAYSERLSALSEVDENGTVINADERLTQLVHGKEGIKGYLMLLHELFDTVVVKYAERFDSLANAVKQKVRCMDDAIAYAYLNGHADTFYNLFWIKRAIFSAQDNIIRKSVEQNDLSLFGKYLQNIEASNIKKLKRKLPELFDKYEIKPIVTDDYIKKHAVATAKTTYDYVVGMGNPKTNQGISFIPIAMQSADSNITADKGKRDAENAIVELFASDLELRGFSRCEKYNKGVLWHKVIDRAIYQRIWFEWHPYLNDLSIFYLTSTLCDNIDSCEYASRLDALDTSGQYYELFGLPCLAESFPNPFSNGNEVAEWKRFVLDTILTNIVYPYMKNTETVKGFSQTISDEMLTLKCEIMCNNGISAYKLNSKYPRIRLKDDYISWNEEKRRVLATDDIDYIKYYFQKCYEHNFGILQCRSESSECN